MEMGKMRLFAVLLVLLVPILAACGGQNQPSATGPTIDPAGQATTAPSSGDTSPAGASTATVAAESGTVAPTTAATTATAEAGGETTATTEAGGESTTPAATTEAETGMGGALTLPEVDPATASGNIVTAGSSTVLPLTTAMAERFRDEGYPGDITVDSVGTGGGFERFCVAGESDIANASRPIEDEERTQCQAIGREPIEFRVGTDALAVVVSQENDFLEDITLADLGRIFSGEVKNWSELDPSYPAEAIQLFSPGDDSGTYDYFVEEVLGDDDTGLQGSGAQFSENDNVLVQGVEGSPYAIGYFGYAYYSENQGRLRALNIEGVEPNATTAEDGSYPLARPLYIYSDASILQEKPQVADFINFYLTYVNEEIGEVGYFPASDEALDEARQRWLDATQG